MREVFSSIGWIHMKRKALGHVMHPSTLNALFCGWETSAEPKRAMNENHSSELKMTIKREIKTAFLLLF
jgi:hypothetical protein